MGALLGGLLGGGKQQSAPIQAAAAAPVPAPAQQAASAAATPIAGLENKLKKPKTKSLLNQDDYLGGNTLLGS